LEEWVRRRQLFAAGLSVALLLGAASPALAKPAKDPKPPKAPSGRVTGGGATNGGGLFAVEARQDKPANGHFNYESADGTLKVRCDGFKSYSRIVYFAPGPPAVHLTADCVAKGPRRQRTPIALDATFVDNGNGKGKSKQDEANLTFTRPDNSTVSDGGALRRGSIQVR
jgi:hypothetical protein